MKDILFTVKQQKCEIKLLVGSFILVNILNIVSIIVFKTEWSEIYTQIFWVLALTGLLYGLSIFLRILYFGVKYLLGKKK